MTNGEGQSIYQKQLQQARDHVKAAMRFLRLVDRQLEVCILRNRMDVNCDPVQNLDFAGANLARVERGVAQAEYELMERQEREVQAQEEAAA